MYSGLISSVDEVVSWLLSASQSVPISQLSLIAWLVFAFGGSSVSRSSFNTPERPPRSLSKLSFQ